MLTVVVPSPSPFLSFGLPHEPAAPPQVGVALIGATLVHLDSSDGQVIAEEARISAAAKLYFSHLLFDAASSFADTQPLATDAAPPVPPDIDPITVPDPVRPCVIVPCNRCPLLLRW